jgi:formamidopyrimidine-DNA glycosylase
MNDPTIVDKGAAKSLLSLQPTTDEAGKTKLFTGISEVEKDAFLRTVEETKDLNDQPKIKDALIDAVGEGSVYNAETLTEWFNQYIDPNLLARNLEIARVTDAKNAAIKARDNAAANAGVTDIAQYYNSDGSLKTEYNPEELNKAYKEAISSATSMS